MTFDICGFCSGLSECVNDRYARIRLKRAQGPDEKGPELKNSGLFDLNKECVMAHSPHYITII